MDDAGKDLSIHEMITVYGIDGAKARLPVEDQHLILPASRVLADETQRLNLVYSGFCQTTLPIRSIEDTTWRRAGASVTMLIESGLEEDGQTHVGLPYGSMARMILIYLQTQAKQNGSPVVEIGGSMHQWLQAMGASTSGQAYREAKNQARRISACSLTFFLHRPEEGAVIRHNGAFVENAIQFAPDGDPRQRSLWQDTVTLHPQFYQSLMRHPVPLQEAAIRNLAAKPMALDIYMWLAWRLHVLDEPVPISWPAVYGQFGGGYKRLAHFRPRFSDALRDALGSYPGAKVECSEKGIVLHPSRSPVEPRLIAVRR